jgi:hypothetical protein
MRNFFITGLPRSRTAWLANLFTTDRTICYHEPTEPWPQILGDRYDAIGASDSTLADRFDHFSAAFPEARWLLVDRDPGSALKSFLEFTRTIPRPEEAGIAEYFRQQQKALDHMRDKTGVMPMPYDALKTSAGVCLAWNWLLPGRPFDLMRWKILDGLNVQQDPQHALRERGIA